MAKDACETRKADEFGDEYHLETDSFNIDLILEREGIEHDRESIILEDSYSALFIKNVNPDYQEIWGLHSNVVRNGDIAYKLT